MGVSADHPGDYQLTGQVDHFVVVARIELGASPDYVTRRDPQIRALDRRRIESYERCVFEKV
jgi:hypothetical protein